MSGDATCRLGTREVRYACYARMPGTAPGMGMPGVDGVTACLLAEEAVQRLDGLHSWLPAGHAEQTLGEPIDHGGFVSRAALLTACVDSRNSSTGGTGGAGPGDASCCSQRVPAHPENIIIRQYS